MSCEYDDSEHDDMLESIRGTSVKPDTCTIALMGSIVNAMACNVFTRVPFRPPHSPHALAHPLAPHTGILVKYLHVLS